MKQYEIDFQDIVENLHDGLYLVDRERRIMLWNRAAERITGFRAEEIVGRSCADNILMHVDQEGNSLCARMCPLAETMGDGRNREDELYLNHREGYRLPVSVRVAPLKNERGEITGAIELFNDIGSREALRLKIVELEKLALLDSLTGLPNRRHLESEIIGNLAKLSRTGESFGLLFFDIDRFKRFNDTCGHRLGDEVLRVLAKTLLSCVRPYDLIGRWGGEEFVGVFPGIDTEGLRRTAERLRTLAAMSRVATGNGSVSVTVSIGGAVASCGDSLDSLLRKVDGLMYHSKNLGGNRSTLEQQGHGTERLAAIDADGGPV